MGVVRSRAPDVQTDRIGVRGQRIEQRHHPLDHLNRSGLPDGARLCPVHENRVRGYRHCAARHLRVLYHDTKKQAAWYVKIGLFVTCLIDAMRPEIGSP